MTTINDLQTNPTAFIQQLGSGYADLYDALDTHPCDTCDADVSGSPYGEKPVAFTHDGGVEFEPYWLCQACADAAEQQYGAEAE